ncbi:MAG TPA: cyanophycinase [Gemmatimonadaceae bacterium]|nr:cyanophycinase [Gemmatimonadaceae bacterium]
MCARRNGDGARAARRRRSDEPEGTLILIGGACTATGEALGTFVRMAGADEGGKIIGLTTASTNPIASAISWKNDFALAGARNVEFPIVDRRSRAQDERIAAKVLAADGIFLGGGDQVHLVATIGGSRVGDAIREAYRRGSVVCGTSAGAAALTETILAGGEPDELGTLVDMHIGPGLGLLGFRAVIDTHFGARRRLHRLFVTIAGNPELLGLGIDEDTALVVRGHLGAVVGVAGVTFVDGRGVRFDNADEVKEGAQLTLSSLRVGMVGNGYVFDLRERELDTLVRASEEGEETPSVMGDEAGTDAGTTK